MQNRKDRLTKIISKSLNSDYLDVTNESHRHHVPPNSETHFKITVVTTKFEGMSLINRHRRINALAQMEFDTGLHALAIHAYTPAQWASKQQQSPSSPNCLDGFKHAKEDNL